MDGVGFFHDWLWQTFRFGALLNVTGVKTSGGGGGGGGISICGGRGGAKIFSLLGASTDFFKSLVFFVISMLFLLQYFPI